MSGRRNIYSLAIGASILFFVFFSLGILGGTSSKRFQDITSWAKVYEESSALHLLPADVIESAAWFPADKKVLAVPRRSSTIWLQVEITRELATNEDLWLEVAPWRVGEITFYNVSSEAHVSEVSRVGLSVPIDQRVLHSRKNLLHIGGVHGQPLKLLIRIESESRPALYLRVWSFNDFLANENIEQVKHGVLLGCVLALVVILLLQQQIAFGVLAMWLLSSFAMQAEQEGYISFQIFPVLRDYGLALRIGLWHLSMIGFVTSSLLLLGGRSRAGWKYFYFSGLVLSVGLILFQSYLDNNMVRTLSVYISVFTLLVWPFSISLRSISGDFYRKILLVFFLLNWMEILWYSINYLLDIKYDGLLNFYTVLFRLGLVVGIIGLYAAREKIKRRDLNEILYKAEQNKKLQLEEEVARRTLDLQEAVLEANSAAQAKTEFLGRVSHDLRSPLTSIIGYAQMLQAEDSAIRRMAGVILKSASHMLALVNDLIDYARGSDQANLNSEPGYFFGFLDAVAMEAKVLADKHGNSFKLNVEDEVPSIFDFDSKRLRQVLINLLDNSAKYTRNGSISLSVTNLTEVGDGVLLRFDVVDTGCGISLTDIPSLFDPFFRSSDNRADGAGLGLFIVHHWVNLMGGELSVSSEVGGGTSISFEITLKQASERDIPALQMIDFARALPVIDGQGLVVWVVEDNEHIRGLLLDDLSGCKFNVEIAMDGQDCLERLLTSARAPDVVLTDLVMPRLDGYSLMCALREKWPSLPVILLSATGHGGRDDEEFSEVLMKPVSLIELRLTLAAVLNLPCSSEKAAGQNTIELRCQVLALTEELRAEVTELIELGAFTDLADWAMRLPNGYALLSERTLALLELGDLRAIYKLYFN